MNCRSARQLISPYLDHQLTGREMLEIQEHFSQCATCAEEMHSILEVKRLLRGLHTPSPRRDLSETISFRLKEAEAETNGWRVLSLPPTRSFSTRNFSFSLTLSSARPPRGRRLATALGLSCLTILSIAAPFAPASRDGAQMTSGFLSSAFLMSPATSPSFASLSGPEMTGSALPGSALPESAMSNTVILNQASAQPMPVEALDLTVIAASPAIRHRDYSVFSAPTFSSRTLQTRQYAVFPADYSR